MVCFNMFCLHLNRNEQMILIFKIKVCGEIVLRDPKESLFLDSEVFNHTRVTLVCKRGKENKLWSLLVRTNQMTLSTQTSIQIQNKNTFMLLFPLFNMYSITFLVKIHTVYKLKITHRFDVRFTNFLFILFLR